MLKRLDDLQELTTEAAAIFAAIDADNDEDVRAHCLFCGVRQQGGMINIDAHRPDCPSVRIAYWLDKWEAQS